LGFAESGYLALRHRICPLRLKEVARVIAK
jgi:hypothetical protein